ncbi:conserved protein of unknown function [Magnetospirillum gryphiswaldense MSR-1 v2]|uniref:Uncharacterized protein n=1 Tax=Magnetospirillum gryphiswaldense (strain DSM 6361 / JCM 21280 / NBRC 15271 / MSR-1) TaxID=431944 RepID=V6F7C4_MAGGM|nr:hypothetical protein [Magnetospirillum gryphiswaldense]CDL00383.1 conserved protein of unknown function [Magnetospirillum gryphiswaldense MSR-1 v2]
MDRSTESEITFRRPFTLRAVGTALPAGTYRLIVDEEMLQGLSFPAWRRVATMLFTPALGQEGGPQQIFTVDGDELDAALQADQAG